jgi:small-conductance mechanosensitive channel
MYCPIGVSSQVVVSGNEGCGYGYGCPFMVQQQQQQQQQQQICISEDEEEKKGMEKSVEEMTKKIHEERLQILTKENQLLAYELEQAKLKYSIQKLVSETRKLSVAVSDAETDTEIDI